jgi:hypothetical protein
MHRLRCNLHWQAAFKHECHALIIIGWHIARILHCFLVGCLIGSMWYHAIVQGCSTRYKTTCLFGIVCAINETHVLGHAVPMKPWWSKRIAVRRHVAGWKNNKIRHCRTGVRTRARQDGIHAGVHVIVGYGINGTKAFQVILVGKVIPMPGNNIKG